MAFIAATSVNFPAYFYPQAELALAMGGASSEHESEKSRINFLFHSTQVKGRYLALPPEELKQLGGFGRSNDKWIESATCLGQINLSHLLKKTGVEPEEVSQITFASSTGLAIPSIEARMINRLPFSLNLKRMPLYGLGCMAGAAGLARVADYLRGFPDEMAIFFTAEFCSLTFQLNDVSLANIVACGLFGDGVGSALLVGRNHPMARPGLPEIVGTRSIIIPNSERVLGFDVVDSGLKIVLDPGLPKLAKANLRPEVEAFLAQHEIAIGDISQWLVHPGGPKVIEAVSECLGLAKSDLKLSYETLEQVGNISSASVLYMLDKVISGASPRPGSFGLMIGMGPGFSVELVLLKW
jgi:alkylresorcinol/alkylpyrone synthase